MARTINRQSFDTMTLIAVRRLKEMVAESRKQTELLRTLVDGKKTPPVNWVKSD